MRVINCFYDYDYDYYDIRHIPRCLIDDMCVYILLLFYIVSAFLCEINVIIFISSAPSTSHNHSCITIVYKMN